MYEIFAHTADLGIRVQADDLSKLFADAARGLFAVIGGDLRDIRTSQMVEFKIAGREKDYLMLDWLSELLFTFETRHLLLSEFAVSVDDEGLAAQARGELFDASRHRLEHEVKAITYHGLKVEPTDGGWVAEVIVDI